MDKRFCVCTSFQNRSGQCSVVWDGQRGIESGVFAMMRFLCSVWFDTVGFSQLQIEIWLVWERELGGVISIKFQRMKFRFA